MTLEEFTKRTLIVAIVAVAVVGVVLLFSRIYPTLLLAFTCWVLAVALNMVVDQLRTWGVRRNIAIGLTIAGVVLLVTLFVILVVPSLVREIGGIVRGLPEAAQDAVSNYTAFRDSNPLAEQFLPSIDPDNLEQTLSDILQAGEGGESVAPLDIAGLLGSATSTLLAVGSAVGNALLQLLLVLLITLFLMVDPTLFERLIVGIVPKQSEKRTIEVLNEVRRTVRQWVGAMLISISVTSVLYWIVLGLILGLPNAVALSVIGGLATIVPTIGPTLAIIPVVIFALAEGPIRLIAAVILYATVGIVQDRIITPAVMKSELNIPAAGLVLFQLVAAALLGFIGVLIAVPLLAVLITLVREILIEDILGKKKGGPSLKEEKGQLIRR